MKKIISGLIVAATLVGCSNGGSEFVGTWRRATSGATFSIEKSGELYVFKNANGLCSDGGSYQNGKLVCQGWSFGYDKNNDTILWDSAGGAQTATRVK